RRGPKRPFQISLAMDDRSGGSERPSGRPRDGEPSRLGPAETGQQPPLRAAKRDRATARFSYGSVVDSRSDPEAKEVARVSGAKMLSRLLSAARRTQVHTGRRDPASIGARPD